MAHTLRFIAVFCLAFCAVVAAIYLAFIATEVRSSIVATAIIVIALIAGVCDWLYEKTGSN